jgi:hypothetical protein
LQARLPTAAGNHAGMANVRSQIQAGLIGAVMTAAAFAQEPAVEVRAVTPGTERLAANQSLYLSIAYAYPAPLRFQARGYWQGEPRARMVNNPAPAYPAGQGDAIVWLAGEAGVQIDEVRVRVTDAQWTLLREVSFPISIEWRAGAAEIPAAFWAAEMMAAQRDLPPVPTAAKRSPFGWLFSGLMLLLVPVAFVSVPGYPLLQVLALVKLRGSLRLLSALPLAFMLPVYAFCLYALTQGSNLWPLYAVFASPVALVITGIVFFIGLRRASRTPA